MAEDVEKIVKLEVEKAVADLQLAFRDERIKRVQAETDLETLKRASISGQGNVKGTGRGKELSKEDRQELHKLRIEAAPLEEVVRYVVGKENYDDDGRWYNIARRDRRD